MQRHYRALGAVASGLLFVAATAFPVWADHEESFNKVDQKCRDSIAKAFAKAVSAAGKVSNTCHKSRNTGKVTATTDCNDLAQADTKGKFASAQQKLKDTIQALCIDAGAGMNTVREEFKSCPEPCSTDLSLSNPLASYTDIGKCLACLAGDIVERSNSDMLGSPAEVLSSTDAACHGAIAKGYQKRLSTILKSRDGCQKDSDLAHHTSLSPCDTSDDKGKIATSTTSAEAGLDSACASASIANLDSCAATNLADLKACLLIESDAAGAEAFKSSFNLAATICPVQINSTIHAGWSETGQQSGTFLEVGWTGFGHQIDIADGYKISTDITCPNSSPPCGSCTVDGVSSNGPMYATFTRCANDFSKRCTTPFQPDNVNCGGGDCVYVLGPPLPISAANNPTCTINALRGDMTGTVDPDDGSAQLSFELLAKVHTGGSATLTHPCPVCVGDPTPRDGVQGGTCRGGSRDGQACDVDASDATFAKPSAGEGFALDCPPSPATNITGVGARIPFALTTGHTSLAFENKCDSPLNFLDCACGLCSGDTTQPCVNDAACAALGLGTCTSKGAGELRKPNGCGEPVAGCVAVGDDKAQCNSLSDNQQFCDAALRANGHGIVACNTEGDCLNSDCDDVTPGLQAGSCGSCTLSEPKPCFLNPIVDDGVPDTENPTMVGTFCLSPTNNAAINGAAGNPGPARVRTDMSTQMVY